MTAFPLFCFQIKILHVPHEKSLFLDTVKPSENRSIGGYSNTVHGHINNHNYYSVCPNQVNLNKLCNVVFINFLLNSTKILQIFTLPREKNTPKLKQINYFLDIFQIPNENNISKQINF